MRPHEDLGLGGGRRSEHGVFLNLMVDHGFPPRRNNHIWYTDFPLWTHHATPPSNDPGSQELLRENVLVLFEETKGRGFFISHQWVGVRHPDTWITSNQQWYRCNMGCRLQIDQLLSDWIVGASFPESIYGVSSLFGSSRVHMVHWRPRIQKWSSWWSCRMMWCRRHIGIVTFTQFTLW